MANMEVQMMQTNDIQLIEQAKEQIRKEIGSDITFTVLHNYPAEGTMVVRGVQIEHSPDEIDIYKSPISMALASAINELVEMVYEDAEAHGAFDYVKPMDNESKIHALLYKVQDEILQAIKEENPTNRIYELAEAFLKILGMAKAMGYADFGHYVERKRIFNMSHPKRVGGVEG